MNDTLDGVAGEALPTVRLKGIEKRFLHTRALDGVSLDVGTGILGLLGPNGAGKTTLLRILATVLAPDAGQVRLLGRDPSRSKDRLEIRRRLGYMPQEPGFHRNFTAFEFVDYVAILKEMTNRRRRHREVERTMGLAGLSGVARKKIRALSGGMRRRVALAQSLLGDPDLLILDEPTAGLDPEQRLRFRDMVSRLGEDRTIIVSTHQTGDVAALCQQVVVMNGGQILLRGTPRDVAEVARGHVWLTEARDPRARLAWRTAEGRQRNIGDAPVGAELAEPTIEDGYLLLVGEQAFSEAA
jgi:ABC-2 type transport system ATP-binding protein